MFEVREHECGLGQSFAVITSELVTPPRELFGLKGAAMTDMTAADHLAEALVLLAYPRDRLNDHAWPAERALFEQVVETGLAALAPDERRNVAAAAIAAAEEEGDRIALDRLVGLLSAFPLPDLSAPIRAIEDFLFCTRLTPGRGTATGAVVAGTAPPPALDDVAMTFVVPFRASSEGRTRNLTIALRALRDATADAPDVEVTVVEQDTDTRLAGIPRRLYDTHVLLADEGPYNKSWGVNAGVARSAHDRICVLDADVLVDRHVVAAMHAGLVDADVFFPHRTLTWLDEVSTARTVAAVTGANDAYRIDGSAGRGLSLTTMVGGCLAVRRDFYLEVGGHDERFTGWGGEDIAFYELAAAHGRIGRGALDMAHLHHARPPVTHADGTMFNEHLPGTTADDQRIGRLRRPVEVR